MVPTPHISAKKGDIAKTVLMPGDPLRAKFIAQTFLKNAKLVSSVRNVLMYTGEYNGKLISVCASGMGQPSIGIYAYELFKFYDVENIIRIGSCGSYDKDLKLYDVVLANKAWTKNTLFSKEFLNKDEHYSLPSQKLNEKIKEVAKKLSINIHELTIHSSDIFYSSGNIDSIKALSKKTGVKCVEMESNALFVIAKSLNKNAACLLTVSDNLITKDVTTSEERQNAFKEMMKIALELS